MERNLLQLQEELHDQTYTPGPYHNFYVYEPKLRLVSAAPFRDRVVHHALCQVIEPIWEPRFIHTSYACRMGKGTHKALDQCHAWARQYRYAFHGDIVKYFPSIDHQILRALLARRIADPQVMWLIDQILDSGAGIQAKEYPTIYFAGDDLFAALRPRGLPIGNLTSQFWANVYLHELDKFVKHQLHCPAYLRYMDDSVLFSDDKVQLHGWKAAMQDYVNNHLRLLFHPRKSVVFPVKVGIDFCGFRKSPLFVKTYDFILWLIPLTLKFLKSQRFLLAERLSKISLDFYDLILVAVMDPESQDASLNEADRLLTKIRLYLRLSYDLKCISLGQLEHAARLIDEIGRLVGGWKRKRGKENKARRGRKTTA